MFCQDKSKATWKKSFVIRKHPEFKRLSEYNKLMKQAIDGLVTFKSQDFIEWTAYNLAEQNNFLGSQDFYWNIAIEKAKAFSSELEALSIILEIEIRRIKHYLRSHFAY